jgi:ribonuclease HI
MQISAVKTYRGSSVLQARYHRSARPAWRRTTISNAPNTADRFAIFTDGGARGNPGPAAGAGVIIGRDGAIVAEVFDYLGVATNNVAEYRALIMTLKRAHELGCRRVDIKMDSELVVRQLKGIYKVKDEKMKPLHAEVRHLLAKFEEGTIDHIRREQNKQADRLVNAVLDAREAALAEERML